MKKYIACFFFFALILLSGCGESDAFENMYGTWTSGAVYSIYGVHEGTTTHTYNEDGTFSRKSRYYDIVTGCTEIFFTDGTFTGDNRSIIYNATYGETESNFCNSSINNNENRPYTQKELTELSFTSVWEIEENTLTLAYPDGSDRPFNRN